MARWLRNRLLADCTLDETGPPRPHRYWLWLCSVGFTSVILFAVLFHGCEQREIIRPTPQMNADSQFWVRVLLAANVTECDVTSPSEIDVRRPGQFSTLQATGESLEPLSHPTKVTFSGGRFMLGQTPLPGNDVILSPQRPHVFGFNGEYYRGRIRLIANPQGRGFDVINLVPLEPYLAGVVGEEMPDYWEPEALKAQAIAARTYCLYIKHRFGVNRNWDVSRTQASQVYGGIQAESSQAWNAVNSTSGKVVVVKGQPRLRLGSNLLDSGLFPAYYSSVCGGHTADSQDVFGDSFSPLKGVPCPYCKDVARLGLFFWPMAQFDRQTVTRQLAARYPKLQALGEIKDIVVTGKRDYGEFSRLTECKLIGATGKTDTLRAEDLRLAIDPTGRKIKSTICVIVPWGDGWAFLSGRGWGHGVGMCQCGAEGLARSGKDAEEILRYYYPGSEIVNAY
jgi:stage II sporulation protein D